MTLSIPEFYKGKRVLITGGTGFVGKALIEKLLRSCPDIGVVYLLLRTKKGVPCEERLKELCSNRVFELLKENNPESFKKLIPISGDVTLDGLGLSQGDREELQKNCNIIFHSAACVRFDQKLKDAVNMNTKGTLRVLTLAESMEKLEAYIHLSTAYCRCELEVLEEKVYPAVHKPRKIMDIVEWMDDATLHHIEPKIIGSEPNTYSYTKAITEDLVDEYSAKFPIAIARPSIVTSAWKEPIPGWVDNLNGPTGILVGSGKGVIRTMMCESSYIADAIAVDVVANACILIGCFTSIDKPKETQVYNLTLSGAVKLTWGKIIDQGEILVNEYPHTVALWYPGGSMKSYRIIHHIHAFLAHTIPAYLVDTLLFLLGKKIFMVNLQRRISHGLDVLQHYTVKQWHFKNENYQALSRRVTRSDNDTFYTELSTINVEDYLKDYILGTRKFVCKEDPSNMPRARRLHRMRYIADRVVKFLFFCILLWFLYSNSRFFSSCVEFLDNTLKRIPPINEVQAKDVYNI